VHRTERSKWRHTFRRLADSALAALSGSDPAPAQQAVTKIIGLACSMKGSDYFHSEDPVEAAKFVVSDAVAALWESILRQDGFAAFADQVPAQLISWESEYGWTRGGYGQVAEKETSLADVLARLLSTPDMWRTFTESYLKALEAVGRREPKKPRTSYGSFDDTSYRREQRTDDLAAWHEMLLDRFAGTPEDELLDQIVASHGLGGPELTFLQAKLAERRGDRAQAAVLAALCRERPGEGDGVGVRRVGRPVGAGQLDPRPVGHELEGTVSRDSRGAAWVRGLRVAQELQVPAQFGDDVVADAEAAVSHVDALLRCRGRLSVLLPARP
jgi:hypothetical protein